MPHIKTKFPPIGSKHTPLHQSVELRWKDYYLLVFTFASSIFEFTLLSPTIVVKLDFVIQSSLMPWLLFLMFTNFACICVFHLRYLCRLFKVGTTNYMLIICQHDGTGELSSQGKKW
ncbi:Phosphatidylinositol 4-phosphate 5-kinase 1 [Nymphaea thermarum]|nr:Phosphatidylinositol 4-phosphate 5-kinase 1 [Nymphaea thermarum]